MTAITQEHLDAVRLGAPMPLINGWASIAEFSTCIEFGEDAEMVTRHHQERYGGRRFPIEMREVTP